MDQVIEVPKIKKAEREEYFIRGCQRREVTRVLFKDGTCLTFSGHLTRKEIVFNGYYQKAMEAGMAEEEARHFAEGAGS